MSLLRSHYRTYWWFSAVAITITGVSLAVLLPWLFWSYNIVQAQRALQHGIAWPVPRLADSMPELRDPTAVQHALAHLSAAEGWHANTAQRARLATYAYLATGNWLDAYDASLTAAHTEPGNPQMAWEVRLAYEHLQQTMQTAGRETLISKLVSEPLIAPEHPLELPFCRADSVASCYIGTERWHMPSAASSLEATISRDVLRMYPGASITHPHTISINQPILEFWLGLNPLQHQAMARPATYVVSVTDSLGKSTQVYSATLDVASARKGWNYGNADLTRWAGQMIHLTFSVTAASATGYEWYGWGDIALTSMEGATAAQRVATFQSTVPFSAAHMVSIADGHLQHHAYEAALRWYQRAYTSEPSSTLQFRIATIQSMMGYALTTEQVSSVQPIYPVATEQLINGAALRWLYCDAPSIVVGDELAVQPGAQSGTMWWGGTAVALVDIEETGQYQVQVLAEASEPAPVLLELGIDGTTQRYDLTRGDGSVIPLTLEQTLSPGIHVISVAYLNNATVGGRDRNAVLHEVRIKRQP